MDTKRSTRRDLRLLGLAGLVMVACANPPEELITQAREAEQSAVAGGAREYAPAAFDEVEMARVALETELATQRELMAIRRSYDQAEALAETYRVASEAAAQQAFEAKEAARESAMALITDSRTVLEQTRALLAVAPVGKGSAADLAAMRGDLDAAQAGLDAAETSVGSELYLEAESAARSAREIIDRVKAALEVAGAPRAG